MQLQTLSGRLGLQNQRRGLHVPCGSRTLVVSHARRSSVSKERDELKQLRSSPSTTPIATPAPAAPTEAAVSQPNAAAPPAPAAAAGPPASTAPAVPPPATTLTSSTLLSSTTPGSSSSGGGSGSSDAPLLLSILATATGVMAVIGIFYSLVFVGGSSVVYSLLKDPITSFTKKDFVPYSERRRLEQEVMAKLEAQEREERLMGGGEAAGAGGLPAPPLAEGASDSSELLTLLPGNRK